ncbi:MAG: DUF7005 family protein [Dehalococcoidia bacterium]
MVRSVEARATVLAAMGVASRDAQELLTYNDNHFNHSHLPPPWHFPLPPEAHVEVWDRYADAAALVGAFVELEQRLVQLCFPIAAGISETESYRAATRRGAAAEATVEATGLPLSRPEQLRLSVHPTLAGPIPILIPAGREDFVALVRALTRRNEPVPIPDSMGACMVAGFNNWDRVRRYREVWEAANPENCSADGWQEEFQRLIPRRELYQDRFIIISDGPYSDVAAAAVGETPTDWQRLSLTIRIEHECTHYFMRRVLDSSRNNVLDELICDYAGIVAAVGHFRSDWFLHFVGLESFPVYREGGRLQNYLGEPGLSERAFKVLQALTWSAAKNLERFDARHGSQFRDAQGKALVLLALTSQTLEDLASDEAESLLLASLVGLRQVTEDLAVGANESGEGGET